MCCPQKLDLSVVNFFGGDLPLFDCKAITFSNNLKGRVSRFSACASDDLSTVKIIVFRPIRSAFTTLAGYGGKLLQLVVDSI